MNFLRDGQRGRKLWRVVQTSEKPYKSFRQLYAQELHQSGSQAVDTWSLWALTSRDARNPVLQVTSGLIDGMDERLHDLQQTVCALLLGNKDLRNVPRSLHDRAAVVPEGIGVPSSHY